MVTDISEETSFYATPSPFRLPAVVLGVSGLVIGLGPVLIAQSLRISPLNLEPMLVASLGGMLVAACGSIAGNHLRNARTLLYVATAAVVVLAGWMSYDGLRSRYEQDQADHRLAADLNRLCREEGGENLTDPKCAHYAQVFDNYHYPNGVPADVEAMRAGELP
jgi:hypothetical protein